MSSIITKKGAFELAYSIAKEAARGGNPAPHLILRKAYEEICDICEIKIGKKDQVDD